LIDYRVALPDYRCEIKYSIKAICDSLAKEVNKLSHRQLLVVNQYINIPVSEINVFQEDIAKTCCISQGTSKLNLKVQKNCYLP
jgi:hypothetical protein